MSKKCFVVCPISDDGSEIRKRSDQLLKHIITPACLECGFDEPERVDLIANPNSITDKILKCLKDYDLVIVDLTDHNPNVFYELGYRVSLNKPVIQLKSKTDTIPFDVANINTLDYNLGDLDDVERTKGRLIAMVSTFDFKNDDIDLTPEAYQQNTSATILQELYQIKDDLQVIIKQTSPDNGTVSLLIDRLGKSQAKTDNQVIMETLLPKLLENPEGFKTLMQLGSEFPSGKVFK